MREVVKLVVVAASPQEMAKCISIVSKVKRYVQRYVSVQVLLVPNAGGLNGIAVEGEAMVRCGDEDETIEQVIDGISRVVSRRRFADAAVAAASGYA